jgi:hypothetical protein
VFLTFNIEFTLFLPPHVMALWRQRDAGNGRMPPM